MGELEDFRIAKDQFFAIAEGSPLTPEQRTGFRGLSYFPTNPDLVIAADLDTDVSLEEVRMQTSTGGEQVYTRAGIVRFEVDDEAAQVTLFASRDTEELFLPFRDATSGNGTYPAGRYLEVEPPGADGRVVVDLNLAYNPYCAYNPMWSCPIPPIENWLKVPIEAGEMSFTRTTAAD